MKKTLSIILLALISVSAFAQPLLRNLVTTNRAVLFDPGAFVTSLSPNTNIFQSSGFTDTHFNSNSNYWDGTVNYTDTDSSGYTGCYVNTAGGFWMYSFANQLWVADIRTDFSDGNYLFFANDNNTLTPVAIDGWGANAGIGNVGTPSYLNSNLLVQIINPFPTSQTNIVTEIASMTNANNATMRTFTATHSAVGNPPDIYWNMTRDEGTSFDPSLGTNQVYFLLTFLAACPGMSNFVSTIHIDNATNETPDQYQLAADWITNKVVPLMHTNGYLVEWWESLWKPMFFSNVVYPYGFYNEMSNMISTFGVDAMTFDNAVSPNNENTILEAQRLKEFGENYATSVGKSFQISLNNAPNYPYSVPYLSGFWHYTGGSGFDTGATTFAQLMSFWNQSKGGISFAGHGHYPYLSDTDNGFSNTNLMKSILALCCIEPVTITLFNTNWISNLQSMSIWTNTSWRAVYKDPAGNGGYLVFTNQIGNSEIYARKMNNGDSAVAFINNGTARTNQTVNFNQLGFLDHTPVVVFDCFENTNIVLNGPNSFTEFTPASTVKLFRFSPFNTTQTNSAPSNVTIGTTAPDYWESATLPNGTLIYKPAWKAH